MIGKNSMKHHYIWNYLNMEDITDTDYKQIKRICKDFRSIALAVQYFYLRENKDPWVLLSVKDKMVVITFHENRILNLGNQYHNDATQVVPGIIEKL